MAAHFISRLAAEDRCHLNGLALRDGRPAYVTAVAETDVADGWRDNRTGGGVVIDVASVRSFAAVSRCRIRHASTTANCGSLNSGTGEIGTVDLSKPGVSSPSPSVRVICAD